MNALKGKVFPQRVSFVARDCLGSEPFPIIEWCEDDLDECVDVADSMKLKKRRNHGCFQYANSDGLIRSKSVKSKLFLLDELDQNQSPRTSFPLIDMRSVHIENLLQITTNWSQVNVVA